MTDQAPTPYLRYPHLHGDLLVAVAADDIWLAPLAGGAAWRLSDDHVPVAFPRFSPDGARVAWASARDGAREVLLAPSGGGEVTRLTWWGNQHTKVIGWTGGDEVLVASPAGEDTLRDHWLKAVGPDGSLRRLPYGPASALAVHPGGAVVLGSAWAREPAYWKRYRGGTAPTLWIDRDGSGQFVRLLPQITAGMVAPMWIGDRIAFCSDHEGVGNLYSVTAAGEDLRRHTDHRPDDGYVRNPAGDGERIVYHALGTVFCLDSLDSRPRRVPITLSGAVAARATRPLEPGENLAAVRPVGDGTGSVVQVRGTAHYLTHRDGPSRVLAAAPGVRVRDATVLGVGPAEVAPSSPVLAADATAAPGDVPSGSTDDRAVLDAPARAVWVTDADGEDAIEVRPLDASGPATRLASGRLGRVMSLQPNADGSRVAVVSHDGRVLLVDVSDGPEAGLVEQLGHCPDGEPEGLAFSPDGAWLAWSEPIGSSWQASRICLVPVPAPDGDRSAFPATSGRFSDSCPAFTADGKYLAFLSARTFDPVYDTYVFDISFPGGIRPHLMPLAATTPAPFGPSVRGRGFDPEPAKPGSQPATAVTTVDRDGLEERVIPFPVPAGHYRDLQTAPGAVFWLSEPQPGVLGTTRADVDSPTDRPALERWDLGKQASTVIVNALDSYRVSADGMRAIVRDGDKVLVLPADKPAGKLTDAKGEVRDPQRIEVDLTRLRHTLEPVAEWQQMYAEAGRLMRDHFWRADMGGVDWDAALARYAPLVRRAAGRDDLIDLLWEVQAELGSSHAYASPPEGKTDPARALGLLGADLSPDDDGRWRIQRILPGESSDPASRSPLRAAGVAAAVGDAVLAVDGRPVGPAGPGPLLVGAAGRTVELTLHRDGAEPRRVAVVPLADEEPLRYQAWVAGRRAFVDQASSGRVGYLHVPDMMAPGWAQLHRDLRLAMDRDGIVVDVRYNRGGHLSQLVVERLSRTVIGWDVGRYRRPGTYPDQAPRGPVVFVANQWSGSDGDIVNAAARVMGIGPIVGVRTWGGVIGIDGRFTLVDGTAVTQPRYATWMRGFGWGLENYGVDPDIEVPFPPQDYAAGRDPQLARAVAEVLDRLAVAPAQVPPEIPPLDGS